MKYVLVTGGVVSGLGKGVTASSVGVVLKACGLRVTSIKIDPYLNTDAGTMSPFEHGEVFVLDDGGEVDLDLGNYERFLDVTLTKDNNITTGKIYQSVIDKERRGDYLGKTVQVVPHITDAIKNWIESVSVIPVDGKEGPADVCVIELGGTVGDIESMPFIEALRQLYFSVGQNNFCLIHVSLIPVLGVVGEQKTKPTQHSVRELRALGLTPNFLACRSAQPLLEGTKQKLSQFCHVPIGNILNIHDVPNIWHIPLLLKSQNAHHAILKQFDLLGVAASPELQEWTQRAETFDKLTNSVRIAMVGKYVGLTDSYLSVVKALLHACIACSLKPSVEWIAASDLEDDCAIQTPEAHAAAWGTLRNANCVLVPGGFGDRGIQGMILAAKYARENKVPYLGICLGMQISVIEYARSVLGLEDANSTEFDDQTPNPVVIFMPEGSRTHMGSTMRLGCRRTLLQTPDCVTAKLYRNPEYVDERHRHRYEVNPDMIGVLEKAGLRFVGKDESGKRMEILELSDHPFFVGVQSHPEFKSRPGRPSALFLGLILAATGRLEAYISKNQNGSV
ncbi:CTP synthase [Impatiens glandulifera]|uniref:CTP synthase n=1 Tax=Impatiens glandulifera TaxID=253017 RepID=UPI001FB0A433|nr:CTP synthase [Impatiens glandulifera]XP_047310925.1 CTP synthase [Impatiens glandulifera]XP_047310926.1 CTP synthase [Impatiens glandulifera]XP_047310927.1 CTP synthase [Impatiens glandulifera]